MKELVSYKNRARNLHRPKISAFSLMFNFDSLNLESWMLKVRFIFLILKLHVLLFSQYFFRTKKI